MHADYLKPAIRQLRDQQVRSVPQENKPEQVSHAQELLRELDPKWSGLSAFIAGLYEAPLLTRRQEMHLFRKMNYLKYRATILRSRLDPEHLKSRLMDRIEGYYREAVATRNEIIRSNLPLVVSIAKRHVGPTATRSELVSDGNMSLIRAVENFDYRRGVKFGTYAACAIVKNFARTIPREHRYHDRFRSNQLDLSALVKDDCADQVEPQTVENQRESQEDTHINDHVDVTY